jgi:hypothetical protein
MSSYVNISFNNDNINNNNSFFPELYSSLLNLPGGSETRGGYEQREAQFKRIVKTVNTHNNTDDELMPAGLELHINTIV